MSLHSTISVSTRRFHAWRQLKGGNKAAWLSSEAGLQWFVLALVAAVDWVWMGYAGFHIGAGLILQVEMIASLIAISGVLFCTGQDRRFIDFVHPGAQYLALLAVLTPLSYLTVSTDAPLMDRTFDAIDKAVGLDWLAWAEWVSAHPAIRSGLHFAYASLPIQMLFCYWHNAYTRAGWKNSEIWWITLIAALVTIVVSALVPGISAWVYYGLAGMDDFLHMHQFEALRAGTLHIISFSNAQGLVQLPSFHTIIAIMLTYNLRHDRRLFLPALALNTGVILSCPTEGGHYFVDIAAGGAVASATIWCVRAMRRRFELALRRVDALAPQ
jgi:hypothetical protein